MAQERQSQSWSAAGVFSEVAVSSAALDGCMTVRVQARDARASAMAQRRKAMAVAPKKRPPVTISGRSRAGSGITMKVHHTPSMRQLSLVHLQYAAGQVPIFLSESGYAARAA